MYVRLCECVCVCVCAGVYVCVFYETEGISVLDCVNVCVFENTCVNLWVCV